MLIFLLRKWKQLIYSETLRYVSLSKRYAAPPDSYTVLELQSLHEYHVSPNAMQMS